MSLQIGNHVFANNLRGFRSSSLRVRITRIEGHDVFVVTADLLDSGTALVLDDSQIGEEVECVSLIHREGLVAFA